MTTNPAKTNDTICAISTPHGTGGIAVIRISGPDAVSEADRIWRGKPLADAASHTAHLGEIAGNDGATLDQAVATIFRGPRSFTGEDVVELSVHGSPYIQHELINLLCDNGVRLAEPGEFTRRAFANGRFDLAQAEAVADLIAAGSKASHHLAISQMRGDFSSKLRLMHDKLIDLASLLELELDFSEEDVEFADRQKLSALATEIHDTVSALALSFRKGDAIRMGVSVAIVGQTNAGKSTLLNRLLHDDRAIVSDIHGTTRDFVEDTIDIDGITFRFTDTAGLRDTDDTIEKLGIQRTLDRIASARIVLWLIDATDTSQLAANADRILGRIGSDRILIPVINKCDIAPCDQAEEQLRNIRQLESVAPIRISAQNGAGLDNLQKELVRHAGIGEIAAEDVIVTNVRHYEALTKAKESLERVIEGLRTQLSGDLIAQDLRETLYHLGLITGQITTSDLLSNIFSKFCIGK